MKHLITLIISFCFINTSQSQTPSFIKDSLDKYVQQGLKDWNLPGLAIVIVKDGKVVLMKGYGVADLETKAPVNENTLFMIASNTKLFTGTTLALLESRKKIYLNDKITKYHPKYELYEKTTTELVTIKDLLSHRIGTNTFQGDFTFWNTKLTRAEIMDRMKLLKPSKQFRADFGYCNSCYLTAGEVIPQVTGIAWEKFVGDSIMKPLQMNNTYMLFSDVKDRKNLATPYTTSFTSTIKKVPYDNWSNLAPAASIVSSVSDLSHWLMFQLDSGRYEGKRVLPFSVLQKTRDINIVTGSRKSSLYPVHFRGYGLGIFSSDYNGKQIFWHTGGAGGMVSNVCFVPEEKLGIAILTNNDNQNLFEALRYQILDAYLTVPYVNRSKQSLATFVPDNDAQLKEIESWRDSVKKAEKPALTLNSYAGKYSHTLNGDLSITVKENKLFIQFETKPDLNATLSYMGKDKWLIEYNNIEYGIFTTKFTLDKDKVKSLTIKVNDFVEYEPYEFVKK